MTEKNTNAEKYCTVGELADKVGVTVRTIQYYDQKNLLKPSVKGSWNQRLYSAQDEEKLYRILCLKFMGLSLNEIGELMQTSQTSGELQTLLEEQIHGMEKEMSALMKRYATMKNLSETVKCCSTPKWEYFADVIERFQDEGKYMWKLYCSVEEQAWQEDPAVQNRKKNVEDWHKLIADAIHLLHRNEPIDSESSHALARRYIAMEQDMGSIKHRTNNHDFVIFDTTETSGMFDSFHELRYEVHDFLQRIVQQYKENEELER